MIHLIKKSNKVIGDNQLLEKRVKKLEKGLEHNNVEIGKLKDIIMGGILTNTTTNNNSNVSANKPPLLDVDDMSGLDDI